jgi:hypothetical protein
MNRTAHACTLIALGWTLSALQPVPKPLARIVVKIAATGVRAVQALTSRAASQIAHMEVR